MRRCVRDFLGLKIMKNAAMWCDRARNNIRSSFQLYLSDETVFSCGKKENFFSVMQELEESDITIDNETLELIRIFM